MKAEEGRHIFKRRLDINAFIMFAQSSPVDYFEFFFFFSYSKMTIHSSRLCSPPPPHILFPPPKIQVFVRDSFYLFFLYLSISQHKG